MKVIEDPFDPVYVTAGPSMARVELQIGEGDSARYARLRPADARRIAYALLDAAEQVDSRRGP